MLTRLCKTHGYEGMMICLDEGTISLCKGSSAKVIVTEWAKPDGSVPTEDEAADIMRLWMTRWQDQYTPTAWSMIL